MGVGPSCLATAGVSIVFSFVENWNLRHYLRKLPNPMIAVADEEEGGWNMGARKEKKNSKSTELSFKDVLSMCLPDWPLFLVAFFALTVAAAGESLIPFLLGKIIDAVALYRNTEDFHRYTLYLVATAAVTGVFTGLRGSTFMVVGARFSVRMRQRLFDSILRQEVAFFDSTKTGEITSR
eukprot:CAMPEP_0174347014 /NCGR_PEP_ID=MMETSP0811_2-20130205/2941_1 /TAXON_ID=73025 ORGANISM="Eutreptiella gymnastica-like, Strain CCMP1594" /NCGR_SAMPLE_ID=MMETSP0811_2 /ASSEMBLY_ACC=CAM_ASM_000667 /LENGTH=179 /DNA_ID=CAMNT_0015472159 /DNA_START=185 /DNA_END=720 /DNA_ORIENTATION=+